MTKIIDILYKVEALTFKKKLITLNNMICKVIIKLEKA